MSDYIIQLFTYLLLVSVAAERAVELTKPVYAKFAKAHPKTVAQSLSAVFGGVSALFAPPTISLPWGDSMWLTVIVVALATSGGSGFWHDMLEAVRVLANPTAKPTTETSNDSKN